ncbi:MAG TPA: hypothetical protein VFK05_39610 [Polyangiaceae bacterium]|nr:hypothetical protein [Polyangiaceae bacterium]
MNQEINKLQELLARVQRNAALPRTRVSGRAPLPAVPSPPAPAVAFAAPPYVPPPTDITAEEMFFDSAPLAAPVVPPPPVQARASLDASVDELLLEDPFPSVPPPAVAYQEEPLPPAAAVPPGQLDHEDDVSGVVAISEFSEDQPEELLEDDIVEMTATEAAQLPVLNQSLDELNFDDVDVDDKRPPPLSEEEPPASSSRSKIAGTMDEALARAAEQIELQEGREVPLKTPPPESGPQAAVALPTGIHAPLAPDIEELLEADILPTGGARAAVPTAEQLGQTIDLDDARGPSLELDQPAAFASESLQEDLPSEELEVTLPGREFGGGYQDDLQPPPEAEHDLAAHRRATGEDSVPPPPESLAQYPSQPSPAQASGFTPAAVAAPAVTTDSHFENVSTVTVDAPSTAEFAPELLARPDIGPAAVAKFVRVEAPRPKTFMELLDTSLALGSD